MKPQTPGSHPSDMLALAELQQLVFLLRQLGQYSEDGSEDVPDPNDYGLYPDALDNWLADLMEYMQRGASTLHGLSDGVRAELAHQRRLAKGDT